MPEYNGIIIGAGQSGLAAGHALHTTGVTFTPPEAGEQPRGSRPPSRERPSCAHTSATGGSACWPVGCACSSPVTG